MKKVTIILMALALLLLAMPVMADGNGIGGDPEATIDVNITVAKYAVIDAPGLEINLEDTETVTGEYEFEVLANFPYEVVINDDAAKNFFPVWSFQRNAESPDEEAGNTVKFVYDYSVSAFDSGNNTMIAAQENTAIVITIDVVELQ